MQLSKDCVPLVRKFRQPLHFLRVQPDGSATKVTWGFTNDTGYNPFCRYMGLMMDGWVGEKYEQGLTDLKKPVESQSG